MKLLTKALEKRFKKVGQQSGTDAIVIAKFFLGPATWYATEFDGEDIFFGYVTGLGHNELGYFSLSELSTVRGQFGLGVERDLYFSECTLKEVMEVEP